MTQNNYSSTTRRKLLFATAGTAGILSLSGCTDILSDSTTENSNGIDGEGMDETDMLDGDDLFIGDPIHTHPREFQVTPHHFGGEILYEQEPTESKPSDFPFSVEGEFVSSEVILADASFITIVDVSAYTCESIDIAEEVYREVNQFIQDTNVMSSSDQLEIVPDGVMHLTEEDEMGNRFTQTIIRVKNVVYTQAYSVMDTPSRTLREEAQSLIEDAIERIDTYIED